jgi:hypothetical protein
MNGHPAPREGKGACRERITWAAFPSDLPDHWLRLASLGVMGTFGRSYRARQRASPAAHCTRPTHHTHTHTHTRHGFGTPFVRRRPRTRAAPPVASWGGRGPLVCLVRVSLRARRSSGGGPGPAQPPTWSCVSGGEGALTFIGPCLFQPTAALPPFGPADPFLSFRRRRPRTSALLSLAKAGVRPPWVAARTHGTGFGPAAPFPRRGRPRTRTLLSWQWLGWGPSFFWSVFAVIRSLRARRSVRFVLCRRRRPRARSPPALHRLGVGPSMGLLLSIPTAILRPNLPAGRPWTPPRTQLTSIWL